MSDARVTELATYVSEYVASHRLWPGMTKREAAAAAVRVLCTDEGAFRRLLDVVGAAGGGTPAVPRDETARLREQCDRLAALVEQADAERDAALDTLAALQAGVPDDRPTEPSGDEPLTSYGVTKTEAYEIARTWDYAARWAAAVERMAEAIDPAVTIEPPEDLLLYVLGVPAHEPDEPRHLPTCGLVRDWPKTGYCTCGAVGRVAAAAEARLTAAPVGDPSSTEETTDGR